MVGRPPAALDTPTGRDLAEVQVLRRNADAYLLTFAEARFRRVAIGTIAALLLATAFELAAFAGHFAVGSMHTPTTVIYDVVIVGAALVCALRALAQREERLAWTLMACAIASWAAGEIYYDLFLANASSASIPSVADIFWLLFYIPAFASVVALIRVRLPQLPSSLWLDGIIGALAVASVSASVVFDAVLHSTHGSVGVVATGLAYPIGDLVLLVMLIGVAIAARHQALSWSWLMMGVGFGLFCAGDSIYLLQTAHNAYVPNGLLDMSWPAALVAIACASWAPQRSQPLRARRPASIATPVLFSMMALGLLIADHFRRIDLLGLALAEPVHRRRRRAARARLPRRRPSREGQRDRARPGRRCAQCEVAVRRDRQPRAAHTAQRRDRDDGAAARHRAERTAARVRGDGSRFR